MRIALPQPEFLDVKLSQQKFDADERPGPPFNCRHLLIALINVLYFLQIVIDFIFFVS